MGTSRVPSHLDAVFEGSNPRRYHPLWLIPEGVEGDRDDNSVKGRLITVRSTMLLLIPE